MTLTGKQRRALRAIGHHLAPIVQIGKEGVTEALVKAVDQALADHELIKLKVLESSPIDRDEAAEALAEGSRAEIAQLMGHTMLLFRRNEDEPVIELPGLPLPRKPRQGEPGAKPQSNRAKKKPARSQVRRAGSRRG